MKWICPICKKINTDTTIVCGQCSYETPLLKWLFSGRDPFANLHLFLIVIGILLFTIVKVFI